MFKLITVSALLSTIALVAAGGPAEVCTSRGGGCVEYQITKDCCAAVDQNTRFDEVFHQCIPLLANGINTGGMVDCCEGRGAGSREEEIGAATSNAIGAEYKSALTVHAVVQHKAIFYLPDASSEESIPKSQSEGLFDKGKDLLSQTLGTNSSKSNEENKEQAKTIAEGTTDQAKGKGESIFGTLFGNRFTEPNGVAKETKGEA
ncbi:hypothetical protein E3P89_03144 [Wallemia ichthyophaga]|uniref:Extracellular membrane protein CFEM domain-containing protein n=1 Tax=Wallemia ichthyophaga TaxID=245174 RepID=A0A4T0HVL9_WALIC|nr:hypothetical protein E3P93_03134 [Wallemia ichthyophaga]TIB09723.1 hypothetical protein E3P90_03165 [Wallemia ichthyophaga]TIB20566.1 hypothetical protein E3P89_03144 [Wallemia ichthyophaga]TIB22173.1 hypothetical protein E3P88_03178 [Wallemia ichthyophaga]